MQALCPTRGGHVVADNAWVELHSNRHGHYEKRFIIKQPPRPSTPCYIARTNSEPQTPSNVSIIHTTYSSHSAWVSHCTQAQSACLSQPVPRSTSPALLVRDDPGTEPQSSSQAAISESRWAQFRLVVGRTVLAFASCEETARRWMVFCCELSGEVPVVEAAACLGHGLPRLLVLKVVVVEWSVPAGWSCYSAMSQMS